MDSFLPSFAQSLFGRVQVKYSRFQGFIRKENNDNHGMGVDLKMSVQ